MLNTKKLRAELSLAAVGETILPRQNALFYDTNSKEIMYSTVVPISQPSITTFSFENTQNVAATLSFENYITSSALPIGVYYAYTSSTYNASHGGHTLQFQINSSDSSNPAFGNHGDIRVNTSHVFYSCGTCGIGNITSSTLNTFSFQFRRMNHTAYSMRGATLTCMRISDL